MGNATPDEAMAMNVRQLLARMSKKNIAGTTSTHNIGFDNSAANESPVNLHATGQPPMADNNVKPETAPGQSHLPSPAHNQLTVRVEKEQNFTSPQHIILNRIIIWSNTPIHSTRVSW